MQPDAGVSSLRICAGDANCLNRRAEHRLFQRGEKLRQF
jgi:hypothetical protein